MKDCSAAWMSVLELAVVSEVLVVSEDADEVLESVLSVVAVSRAPRVDNACMMASMKPPPLCGGGGGISSVLLTDDVLLVLWLVPASWRSWESE